MSDDVWALWVAAMGTPTATVWVYDEPRRDETGQGEGSSDEGET